MAKQFLVFCFSALMIVSSASASQYVAPTSIAAMAGLVALPTTPKNEVLRLIVPSPDFKLRIKNGSRLSVKVKAQAQTKNEIAAYLSGTRSESSGHDVRVMLGASDKPLCRRDYEGGRLIAIQGVCVNEVTIVAPPALRSRILVNGVPADGRALSFDEMTVALGDLVFEGAAIQREKAIRAYLAGLPKAASLSQAQYAAVLARFSDEDERVALKNLLSPYLSSEAFRTLEAESLDDAEEISGLFVDIRDLDQMSRHSISGASEIVETMNAGPERFFPEGLKLDDIFGIEITAVRRDIVSMQALIPAYADKGAFFRRYELTMGGQPLGVTAIRFVKDIPLAEGQFSVRVGLVQRKAIVEDRAHGIRKIFPIGVGGFDMGLKPGSGGRVQLVTPRFRKGSLNRSTAYDARTEPDYYRGEPFIPLSRADGHRTPISFHIYQSDKLRRGFVSHGCMHLRERDLREVLTILRQGARASIPIDVSYYVKDRDDHPYPMEDASYGYVENCAGAGEAPHACKDPRFHNELTLMYEKYGIPPVAKIDLMATESGRFDFDESR